MFEGVMNGASVSSKIRSGAVGEGESAAMRRITSAVFRLVAYVMTPEGKQEEGVSCDYANNAPALARSQRTCDPDV